MSNPHLLEVAQSLNVILSEFIKDSEQIDDCFSLCLPQTLPDGHEILLFDTVNPKAPGLAYLLSEYHPDLSKCNFKIIVPNNSQLSKSAIIEVEDPLQCFEIHRQLTNIFNDKSSTNLFFIKYRKVNHG